jgi:hypothetical protein
MGASKSKHKILTIHDYKPVLLYTDHDMSTHGITKNFVSKLDIIKSIFIHHKLHTFSFTDDLTKIMIYVHMRYGTIPIFFFVLKSTDIWKRSYINIKDNNYLIWMGVPRQNNFIIHNKDNVTFFRYEDDLKNTIYNLYHHQANAIKINATLVTACTISSSAIDPILIGQIKRQHPVQDVTHHKSQTCETIAPRSQTTNIVQSIHDHDRKFSNGTCVSLINGENNRKANTSVKCKVSPLHSLIRQIYVKPILSLRQNRLSTIYESSQDGIEESKVSTVHVIKDDDTNVPY